jgi:hypothetical protein
MRTLSTQVRLRRLVRAYAETLERLRTEPRDGRMTTGLVARLQELMAGVLEAWNRERAAGRPEPALAAYVNQALRTADFAIAGLGQDGADVQLLQQDFEEAALPLEVFLRGLDTLPALQRSA